MLSCIDSHGSDPSVKRALTSELARLKVGRSVRLFNKPYFEVTIAVQVPELRLPHAHRWLATIDAKAKTFSETMLAP